jgi:hypothetical protein
MTRAAAREGLLEAIDALVEAAHEEFDPVRALRRGSGGSRTVSRLLKRNRLLDRHVVRPELERYRERARRQANTLLDAVEAGEDPAARREELLDADLYYGAVRRDASRDAREAVETAVIERFRAVGEGVEPLVASPAESFWPAVVRELDEPAARDLVAANFSYSERMRRHRRAFVFETCLDPGELLGGLGRALPEVSVEYTHESLRAMGRAEQVVRREFEREIDRRF